VLIGIAGVVIKALTWGWGGPNVAE